MTNKTIANWLIAGFATIVLAILSESPLLEMCGGLAFWVFGIWAIVRLYKLPEIK